MLESKGILPPLIPNCYVLCTLAILKTFVICSFFFKKWLLTHVFGGFQGHKSSASKLAPDASKFTRFKQDFLSDLQSMFDHLVNLTEPICQKRNPDLAGMTILIPPVLKHGLRKIILSMQIVLLNS